MALSIWLGTPLAITLIHSACLLLNSQSSNTLAAEALLVQMCYLPFHKDQLLVLVVDLDKEGLLKWLPTQDFYTCMKMRMLRK